MIQRSNSTISMLRFLVISVRPWEWIKNALLFAALFYSKNLLNPELLAKALLAFGLFCQVTGGVYLINDIWDRDEDKKHPHKRTRPIASGALPVGRAAPAAVFLLIAAYPVRPEVMRIPAVAGERLAARCQFV